MIFINIYIYKSCVYFGVCKGVYVYLNTNYANLSPNLDFPLMKWF